MNKKTTIRKVVANGMRFYQVEGIKDKLFLTRESAKEALERRNNDKENG